MVLRTYKTGLSLVHFPRKERKAIRHKLADIIEELSDENLKHARKFSKKIMDYLIDNNIDDLVISDPLPGIIIGKGKFGVNELMTHIGIANNHLHSSYHLMANSAKGYLDRVFKFQKILEWFKEEKLEMVKWVLWQRSTYQINEFKKRWNLNFHYLDPLMRGVHKRFFKDSLPCFLREITLKEFMDGLQAEISRIEAQEEKTEGTMSFLRSLYYLQKKLEEDPEIIHSDLAFIPTGWKNLKFWVENLELKKYGLKRWASVIRSVLSQVYFSDYEEMI
ncbi:MAG: hypothetical protein KAR35_07035, partial [Candidatus Heimdallarchaeota archaeon]|nr:hypothetical protein [Candidatus Heimdallarchaeota archaeon]MCK5049113.1 hypothetical protein [Candidatus Heimdallarchaeota archaeon]